MNDIFSDLLDICVLIYLDDILIYSNNPIDHEKHVREVLLYLWKNKLYACANKYSFHQDMVEYLGYIIALDGLTMNHNKVKVIQDWPEPHKVKDVQSFLDFANFYRWFSVGDTTLKGLQLQLMSSQTTRTSNTSLLQNS